MLIKYSRELQIIENQKASISMLQRDLKIGFNRAEKIMNQLVEIGIVGDYIQQYSAIREILVNEAEWDEICTEYGWVNPLKLRSKYADFPLYSEEPASNNTVAEETEEPTSGLRNLPRLDFIYGSYIEVSDNKIKYGVPTMTKFGEVGTLNAEFSGSIVTDIIFKKSSFGKKGFLQFKYSQDSSINNQTPLLINITNDNVSDLAKIEFTRTEEDDVWAYAEQISEDIQCPITLI